MFEIQEDHVIVYHVAKKVIASMANVTNLVKTTMTAQMKINVGTKSVCQRYVQ